ncbi:hypothetical protein BC830DRAFT_1101723 [Chytriomyces sp. MP71]|nr:hypothetical protein BC830DRAFT_1101723 [Chytriomyces sp. MP71]
MRQLRRETSLLLLLTPLSLLLWMYGFLASRSLAPIGIACHLFHLLIGRIGCGVLSFFEGEA